MIIVVEVVVTMKMLLMIMTQKNVVISKMKKKGFDSNLYYTCRQIDVDK